MRRYLMMKCWRRIKELFEPKKESFEEKDDYVKEVTEWYDNIVKKQKEAIYQYQQLLDQKDTAINILIEKLHEVGYEIQEANEDFLDSPGNAISVRTMTFKPKEFKLGIPLESTEKLEEIDNAIALSKEQLKTHYGVVVDYI